MASKQEIIASIYYDKAGYGSKSRTLQESREKDKSITKAYIDDFFNKHIEIKTKPRGQNSYIPPKAFHEFQADLFFIKDLDNQKTETGMLIIDPFSKYMTVVPIMSKDGPDVAHGFIQGFKEMGGLCKLLYTDDETSFSTKYIQEYFKDKGIQHYITRHHAAFAEVAIKTFKRMLYDRIEADEKKGKTNIDWQDYVFEILLTYNNKMVHSTTGFLPRDAKLPKNEFEVKLNISMKASHNRKYPELNVSDKVKIARKKGISEKQQTSHWLKSIHTVERIETKLGQKYYYVSDFQRPLLRHEMLKL